MESEIKLTSVRIPPSLYDNFKIFMVKDKISFTELVHRSMFLYITNEDFRKQILNTVNTVI